MHESQHLVDVISRAFINNQSRDWTNVRSTEYGVGDTYGVNSSVDNNFQ